MAALTRLCPVRCRPSIGIHTQLRQLHTELKSPSTPIAQWASKPDTTHLRASEVPVRPQELSYSPLARLPTFSIIRSLFLSIFFTTPILFKPGLAIFSKITNSESRLLNPDKNPLIRTVIRPFIYDQFCAGRNAQEIQRTSAAIKGLGFSGVVLCYGKEVQIDGKKEQHEKLATDTAMEAEIEQWRKGNIETLAMVGKGDWLGIKYTGAGLHVTNALLNKESAPAQFMEAMDDICRTAEARGCRIWIDAEQQAVEPCIDQWTYEIMRRHNKGEEALVYNTVQAYLKQSRNKIEHQLQLAAKEGWRSGIKLVRGAYIANDLRRLIHDTKEDTDTSYNGIVEDLLRGTGFSVFQTNPNLQHDLLLAGHNTQTIRRAASLARELAARSELKVVPDFAQLQGMADDIGCELVDLGERASRSGELPPQHTFVPRVYKCLTWGSIQECMQYLLRRLVENRGAADRMTEGAIQLRQELWRRVSIFR